MWMNQFFLKTSKFQTPLSAFGVLREKSVLLSIDKILGDEHLKFCQPESLQIPFAPIYPKERSELLLLCFMWVVP